MYNESALTKDNSLYHWDVYIFYV